MTGLPRRSNAVWVGLCLFLMMTAARPGASQADVVTVPAGSPFHAGKLLYSDNFEHGLAQWRVEMQQPGTVTAKNGVLDIDVPAGVTVWFKPELHGPVMIQYQATVISAGGPHDRVSDLNSFWMATDPAHPADIFAVPRTGAFAGYNTLDMYYVGLGGNTNRTTRFRRYIGSRTLRPMLPENDISVAKHPEMGIVPNRSQTVTLIADGSLIEYYRDGKRIFKYVDAAPYTEGWFGIRTTKNHMQVRNLRIVRLIDK